MKYSGWSWNLNSGWNWNLNNGWKWNLIFKIC